MRVRGPLLTAAFVVCLATIPSGQQTAPPVFRSGVDVVELDVVATDANGDPVTDLTAEDFEVREQGRVQSISSFTRIDIPIVKPERPLFAGREIEPDVQSNDGDEGRIYVIAFDVVDPADSLRTRNFLRGFIDQHFGTNDLGAVVYLGRANRSEAQDLTSSRRLLLDAIDKFSAFPSAEAAVAATTPATDAADAGTATIPGDQSLPGSPTGGDFQRRHEQRQAMSSFRSLAEFMATLKGRRKSLLYISAGWQFDVFDVVDYNGGVLGLAAEDAHAALRAATRGNVTVYTIDPRGLSLDGAADAANADPPQIDRAAALQNRANLRALAELTGGFGFVSSNDFDRAFERIVRENSSYYLLGYSPTDERRDGRFRKLEVRVKRPGVQVRARTGYMAPRGNERPQPQLVDSNAKLSPPVRESLGSAVATHGVQMRVSAAPYKGTGKEAMIALTIETSAAELGLTPAGDTLAGELEVGFLSIDVRNKVTPGNFHLVKLALQNARGAAAGRTVRVIEEARLAPGRYQVRAALGNRAGKSGSVVYDLQVPDFAKAPLVMSGVALTSELAGRAVTVRGKEPLKDLLPGPPTAAREFSTADVITLYTEVYDNLRPAAGHTVRIAAELRAEGGQAVRTVTDERTSKDLDGSRGGYGFTAEFPLVGVEPGRYVIHVEARADTGDRPEVARDILVTIR